MIIKEQCKAARALLDWTLDDLAKADGCTVSRMSLHTFENGGNMRVNNQTMLRSVFEHAGIEFIDQTSKKGPGVRFKEPIHD